MGRAREGSPPKSGGKRPTLASSPTWAGSAVLSSWLTVQECRWRTRQLDEKLVHATATSSSANTSSSRKMAMLMPATATVTRRTVRGQTCRMSLPECGGSDPRDYETLTRAVRGRVDASQQVAAADASGARPGRDSVGSVCGRLVGVADPVGVRLGVGLRAGVQPRPQPFRELPHPADGTGLRASSSRSGSERLFDRGGRTRTCNPRFWRPVLYQLSHAPGLQAPV